MIYLFGNCQTGFLCNALTAMGVAAESRQLASPLTYADSPGFVDPELADMVAEHQAEDYFHLRPLRNQLVLLSHDDEPADCAVFSMFHEPGPLFLHPERSYSFFIDPAVIQARPVLGRYLTERFQAVGLNPATYFQRFGRMIERFRKEHPHVPVVVLSRLSHHPGFGPRPWSYLEGWDDCWNEAGPALEEWASTLGGCHVLSMDRVFAAIWNEADDPHIEEHCPFLRFMDSGAATPWYPEPVRRDVEHVGSLWPVLAQVIAEFTQTGKLRIPGDDSLPRAWKCDHIPERLGEERMAELMHSGGNYHYARAVSSLFLHQDRDLTPLLEDSAPLAPVCHNTLHMLRAFARHRPTTSFLAWLMAHADTARAFTANGEAYRNRYLERLKAMTAETWRALRS